MKNVTPVILCGGSGTRLWPLSRKGFPKQFLALTGEHSLFQQTLMRLNAIDAPQTSVGETLVLTGEDYRFLALEQLREVGPLTGRVLLEPSAKNTAPALTLAALHAVQQNADAILLVSPADQNIADIDAFMQALNSSIEVAAAGAIVILGVCANKPETGFGYIKCRGSAGEHSEYTVAAFTEKPDLETAQAYLASGEYTWNSGIFVLKAAVWLVAIEFFRPDIFRATQAAWQERHVDGPFLRVPKMLFDAVPEESIDCAVIERCPNSIQPIKMVSLDAGWSDLGAWDAIWNIGARDAQGNCLQGDAVMSDTRNTLIKASSRLVAAVGLDNLVIVETPDAVLVMHRDKSQDVKNIVDVLRQQQRPEQDTHRKVHRPWGWYDCIDESERFKVKRIMVKPGASLSLQKHQHRAEHWVVVKGTAQVVCGDKTSVLIENQSTYIPLGEVHRLINPGVVPLEIIEVQSGIYLGEDDIVRLEDSYDRSES